MSPTSREHRAAAPGLPYEIDHEDDSGVHATGRALTLAITPDVATPLEPVRLEAEPAPAERDVWTPRLRPAAIVRWLAIAAAIVMAASIVAVVIDEVFDYNGSFDLLLKLDADREGTAPAWLQSALLLAASLLWFCVARTEMEARRAWPWLLLSGVFLAASLDEIAALHDYLSEHHVVGGAGVSHFAWVVPGAIFAAALAAAIAHPVLSLPASARRLLILAGATYITGALLSELVGGLIADRYGETGLGYRLDTQLEETLETAGLVILVYGLLRLLALRNNDAPLRGRQS